MKNNSANIDCDNLPDWLRHGLRYEYDATVDGRRWVTDGHVAIRVAGQASLLLGTGRIGELLASKGVQSAVTRLVPGAAVLEGRGTGHEPGVTECEECGEWFGLGDGCGSMVGHYFVPMGNGVRLSLCYAAVIPHLFGEVEWFGSGPYDPVVVKASGEIVAVVMPAPKVSEEGQASRP